MGNSVSLSPLIVSIDSKLGKSSDDIEDQSSVEKSEQSIKTQFPFYLAEGKNNEVIYLNQQESKGNLNHILYKFSISCFTNIVVQIIGARQKDKIWKFIEEYQTLQFQVNGIIKVGSLQIKLMYLINDQHNSQENKVHHQCSQSYRSSQFSNRSGGPKCRVCFQPQLKEQNPLISLCKCEGSVKLIHYQCLKKWLEEKIKETQQPNCVIYQYPSLRCQLCKDRLPSHFWHGQKFFSLIQKKRVEPPYAILQIKNVQTNVRNQKNMIYTVKLNEGLSVTIGRSGESDLPVKSSTVSRKHCLLFYSHKQLYVKDLKSKYGTFLYHRNAQYDFTPQNGLTMLINETKVNINKNKESFFSMKGCKDVEQMRLRVIEDSDDKFTVETSWDIFDFL